MLLSALGLVFTLSTMAQPSSLDVYNETECYIEVTAWAYNATCDDKCPSATVCLPPGGGFTLLAPCGQPNWQWEFVAVEPVRAGCRDCGSSITSVGVPGAICKNFPNTITGIDHCDKCDPFTAEFVHPTTLVMY